MFCGLIRRVIVVTQRSRWPLINLLFRNTPHAADLEVRDRKSGKFFTGGRGADVTERRTHRCPRPVTFIPQTSPETCREGDSWLMCRPLTNTTREMQRSKVTTHARPRRSDPEDVRTFADRWSAGLPALLPSNTSTLPKVFCTLASSAASCHVWTNEIRVCWHVGLSLVSTFSQSGSRKT